MSQVAADLRAAADVLERDGWTQGELVASDGCRCLMGALDAVFAPRIKTSQTSEQEEAALYEEGRAYDLLHATIGTRLVATWNDEPERTAAEVIAALRAAADRAEAEA